MNAFVTVTAKLPWLAFLSASILIGGASAQTTYGTVQLPADIADASAKVLGALNKDPSTGKFLLYCEGPAVDPSGNLFFVEFFAGTDQDSRIWKVTPDGKASIFHSGKEGSNGMEFDPQGRLVVCQINAVTRYDAAGSPTTLASSTASLNLHSVNDLSIANSGAMYFTNHATGNEVFYMGTDGKIKTFPGFTVPNGIEWIEEKKLVYVTLATDANGKVVKYRSNDDGTLTSLGDFASVDVPDGLTLDEKGNVYVASWGSGAIMVFDSTGKSLGKITVNAASGGDASGNTSNCVFGGPGNKTLYITGDGGAYQVQLKIPGRKRPATTAIKVKTPAPRSGMILNHGPLHGIGGPLRNSSGAENFFGPLPFAINPIGQSVKRAYPGFLYFPG